jgi:hypothetical protein
MVLVSWNVCNSDVPLHKVIFEAAVKNVQSARKTCLLPAAPFLTRKNFKKENGIGGV